MEYVIGCDIGSQTIKTVLLTVEGQVVAESSAGYPIQFPGPAWAEQQASDWITALIDAIRNLLKVSRVSSNQVACIGLDAQVDGIVVIDAAGAPLRPAIVWMDRRATAQVEKIRENFDPARIFQISGLNLDASHVAPKIRWIADEQSEIYDQARCFLLPASYVAYRLTGELGVDYSNASSMLLMDIRTKQWSAELCEAFEIPVDRLPPIYPATVVLGTLLPEIGLLTGLSKETRVILGCGDEHAACLGAGVIKPGLVCDTTGTAEPAGAASSQPCFDETGLVETHCHAHPDLWLLENPGFVSGGNYRWFRDRFGQEEVEEAILSKMDAYAILDQAANSVPAGSDGLVMLPCLMGAMTPTWNPSARGTFVGFTLAHEKRHFARAILEASAYALRDITERMQEMGLNLEEIRVVGGGARSALWRQIKADVTGLPITLLNTIETTALGAGLLALAGAGYFESLDQAAEAAISVVEQRDPDPQTSEIYTDYYQLYREAYFSLTQVFERAAGIKP
jgi:xylulokinase